MPQPDPHIAQQRKSMHHKGSFLSKAGRDTSALLTAATKISVV